MGGHGPGSSGSMTGCCGHGNEFSGTVKCGKISRLAEELPASQEVHCFVQLVMRPRNCGRA